MLPRRPTTKELHAKVRAALEAITAGDYQFLTHEHLVASLEDLGLENEDALLDLILEILTSLSCGDPLACYAGQKPPTKSYENLIRGLDLWAFACFSETMNQTIYLKFALKQGVYVHISCHEDQP